MGSIITFEKSGEPDFDHEMFLCIEGSPTESLRAQKLAFAKATCKPLIHTFSSVDEVVEAIDAYLSNQFVQIYDSVPYFSKNCSVNVNSE